MPTRKAGDEEPYTGGEVTSEAEPMILPRLALPSYSAKAEERKATVKEGKGQGKGEAGTLPEVWTRKRLQSRGQGLLAVSARTG